MGDADIASKLARYTYAYPEDEASVVYMLVQMGKSSNDRMLRETSPFLPFIATGWCIRTR